MTDQANTGLKKTLGLTDSILLVMGASIGSGIFLTSGLMANEIPDPIWILAVWVIGSVLTLFGGLTLAELGAMLPEAGGQYVYLREAYGPFSGFLYGWTTFLVTQTGGIAALGVGFAEYLSYFLPELGLNVSLVRFAGVTVSNGQLVALVTILGLTAINFYSLRGGSTLQNIFTITKIGAIVILVLAGLYAAATSNSESLIVAKKSIPGIASIGIALIAVLWTFDGWYSVTVVASEIKNVKRTLPISLALGITLTGIIYFFINLFYVQALPMQEMAGVVRIGEKAVTYLFGTQAADLMSGLILISILGCLSATIIFGPRIFYAMSKDGLFFRSMGRVHPVHRTPHIAILWQGGWAAILCLSGTYEQLFTYVVFVLLLFYVGSALGVIILRRKRPNAERPYKVWGYPWIPILFAVSMLWIMINTLIEKPVEAIIGMLLIFTGWPVYYYWKKQSTSEG